MSSLMTKAEFARLCQVSQPMVTKYAGAGRLAMTGKKVDALASLQRLEGHLDEGKRRAALDRLNALDDVKTTTPTLIVEEEPEADKAVAGKLQPVTQSWKAEREKAQALNAQLDLAERQGLLVDAAEVKAAVADAVTTFWSELDRRHRQKADELAGRLKLDADEAKEVRTFMARFARELQKGYSDLMHQAAEDAAPSQSKVA